MIWPTICIDDFFINLKEVVKFANSLSYKSAPGGEWPGERAPFMHTIDPDFFHQVGSKIVSVLYPNEWTSLCWNAEMTFQRIDSRWQGEGWVHQDSPNKEISCIIYLDGDENCGTSLYKQIHYSSIQHGDKENSLSKIKKDSNRDPSQMKSKLYREGVKKNNSRFKKTVTFDSVPNRCIIFDSSNFHAVNSFNSSKNKNRLTLITFFEHLSRAKPSSLKYPGEECRRL